MLQSWIIRIYELFTFSTKANSEKCECELQRENHTPTFKLIKNKSTPNQYYITVAPFERVNWITQSVMLRTVTQETGVLEYDSPYRTTLKTEIDLTT